MLYVIRTHDIIFTPTPVSVPQTTNLKPWIWYWTQHTLVLITILHMSPSSDYNWNILDCLPIISFILSKFKNINLYFIYIYIYIWYEITFSIAFPHLIMGRTERSPIQYVKKSFTGSRMQKPRTTHTNHKNILKQNMIKATLYYNER